MIPKSADSSPPGLPARILVLAVATNFISYCDRVCISVAAPYLRQEFGLTAASMGVIFGAFSLAYALFLTPWGMLADRSNPRKLIAGVVVVWSALTAATSLAWNYSSMLVIRFLFGAAESALSPAVASVIARTTAAARRSTVFGAFLGGGRLGGTLAPPLAAFLVLHFGWRRMFLVFAAMGLILPFLWLTARDRPDPGAARASAPDAERTDWRELLRSGRLALLMGVAFGYTIMWQFYPTWFPTYLMEKRHFTLAESSWYAGLPFLFGLAATWAGGILTDLMSAKMGIRRGRAVLGACALLSSASLLTAGMLWPGREVAAILIALAAGAGDMVLGVTWATAVEIGGKSAGAVSGLMNAASNGGGFVSPLVMGWIVSASGEWNFVLAMAALANALSAVLWLMLYRQRAAV